MAAASARGLLSSWSVGGCVRPRGLRAFGAEPQFCAFLYLSAWRTTRPLPASCWTQRLPEAAQAQTKVGAAGGDLSGGLLSTRARTRMVPSSLPQAAMRPPRGWAWTLGTFLACCLCAACAQHDALNFDLPQFLYEQHTFSEKLLGHHAQLGAPSLEYVDEVTTAALTHPFALEFAWDRSLFVASFALDHVGSARFLVHRRSDPRFDDEWSELRTFGDEDELDCG
ncbi:hypothetical protein T492DRAFT_326083 [Pavlovales sp. CCMP2436]|nr:hypothetical protein T492DRAFT_326083 [Pavlovales sp. CCMP2436]